MSMPPLLGLWTRLSTHRRVYAVIGAVAVALIALQATPSSYGSALEILGSPGAGLLAFHPRPVRSDEWAVITPAIQATVNNHFARYNATSFYKEDLRQVYALPVHDWGIVFRPTMWLFGLASPSVAFSFHHVAMQVMCLVGFALLFRRSGLVGVSPWLLSSCIFWCGFVQYFWTTVGPVVAWWPWLTLAIIHVRRSLLALPLVAYVFACWALSFFYPPLLISLGFVTACVLFAFRRNRLPVLRLAACGLACAIGAALSVYYLRDTLIALNDTFYPGQRRVGGGGLWAERVASMFVPYAFIAKSEPFGLRASLPPTNICEFGVVGTSFFLFAALLVSPRKLLAPVFKARRIELAVLFSGLIAVFAWMVLELPASVGAVLLWDRVPPGRMVMASGILLSLVAIYVVRYLGTRLTLARCAVGIGIILVFIALKVAHGSLSFRLIGRDLAPAVGLVAVFLARRRMSPTAEHASLLAVSAITNILCFGSFNPVQRAGPIFDPPSTPELRGFAERAQRQHGRPLLDGFPGRVLNGLGYSAVAHVEAAPQMTLWRTLLPEVPERQMQEVFNRYAHIIISDEEQPRTPQPDVALLPKHLLLPRVNVRAGCDRTATVAGVITAHEQSSSVVVIEGRVPAAGVFRDQVLQVVATGVQRARVNVSDEALDVVDPQRDEHAFTLSLELAPGQVFDPAHTCVVFLDERDSTAIAIDDPSVDGECAPCTYE